MGLQSKSLRSKQSEFRVRPAGPVGIHCKTYTDSLLPPRVSPLRPGNRPSHRELIHAARLFRLSTQRCLVCQFFEINALRIQVGLRLLNSFPLHLLFFGAKTFCAAQHRSLFNSTHREQMWPCSFGTVSKEHSIEKQKFSRTSLHPPGNLTPEKVAAHFVQPYRHYQPQKHSTTGATAFRPIFFPAAIAPVFCAPKCHCQNVCCVALLPLAADSTASVVITAARPRWTKSRCEFAADSARRGPSQPAWNAASQPPP
jgi:hypothetical protein